MSLTIPANDHGQIRVFALGPDAPAGDLTPDMLKGLLGTDALDLTYVDLVDPAALGALSLSDYIAQGYDMTPDAADAEALRGITGRVLLVMSRAAGGAEVTLTPSKDARHVTTLGSPATMRVAEKIDSAAADPTPTQPAKPASKAPSDAAMGGRIAMIALIVLFALVAVMIWVGG